MPLLKPIPGRIMRTTVTVKVCRGVDLYQNPDETTHIIKRVHVQATNEIRKTADNTDCVLRSILFADRQHSTPFEWNQEFKTAHEKGGDVKVICRGEEYTVFTVDELRDDTDQFHHWEVGLR